MRNNKQFRYNHNFSFIVFAGLSLSLANAVWAFLLSIAESKNGNPLVTGITMAIGLMPMGLILMYLNKEKFDFSVYPILTGVFFGASNILLLSIFNYKDSAIIYSLIAPTIIVFVIMQVLVNRRSMDGKEAIKLVIGGAMAGTGFILLSLSGLDVSIISFHDILISLVLIISYGIAGFLLTETGLKSRNTGSSMLTVAIAEIAAMLLFYPFYAAKFSYVGVQYSFLAGFIVSFGIAFSFVGYKTLSKSKKAISYSSILYILSEMETLFLVVIYSIFVGSLTLATVASIALIAVSVWYLSMESDKALG
ncbi:MAG: hypothetical protein M1433_02165 [Candidatus Parvarchaeota archaeon]|nr:hypothetical protein [Candidatus Parvarchaeota archaeon]